MQQQPRESSWNERESTQDTNMYENQAYQEWEQQSNQEGARPRSSAHPSDIHASAHYRSPSQGEPYPDEIESDGGGCGTCCGVVLRLCCFVIFFFTLPFSLCYCIKVVQEYERAVMFRLGRCLPGAKGPGMFFILPCIEEFVRVDLRTKSFDIPPQEILTKDSVTVSVDAVVYYCVSDPIMSVIRVADCYSSSLLLAQTSLRNVLGTKELREVLSQRDQIAETLLHSRKSQQTVSVLLSVCTEGPEIARHPEDPENRQTHTMLDEATDPWGVKIERVEIKDVRLPAILQRAMAKEAESQREAHAKVIAANGERQAAKALKEAAMVMSENASALKLRYLQTLTQISAEKPSTILFPLPMDTLGGGMMK